MEKTTKNAIRNGFIAWIILSIFSFFYGVIYTEIIKEGLEFSGTGIFLSLLASILIAGSLGYLSVFSITIIYYFLKNNSKQTDKFRWWEIIFYIIGWLVGILSPLFWLIMLGIHQAKNYGQPFINKDFHRRVYIWGMVLSTIFVIVAIVIISIY